MVNVETKFNVGDTFWAIYGLGVSKLMVYRIKIMFDGKNSRVSYIASDNNLTEFYECRMFKTKNELLESL